MRDVDTRSGSTERDGNMADEIIEDEIKRAIWKLRSDKASGVCGIQVELLKAGGEIIVSGYRRFAIWYGG